MLGQMKKKTDFSPIGLFRVKQKHSSHLKACFCYLM
ncbi:unnamed protein product, partial [Larinioides sclopetarius]